MQCQRAGRTFEIQPKRELGKYSTKTKRKNSSHSLRTSRTPTRPPSFRVLRCTSSAHLSSSRLFPRPHSPLATPQHHSTVPAADPPPWSSSSPDSFQYGSYVPNFPPPP